jgi:hypothetical protein
VRGAYDSACIAASASSGTPASLRVRVASLTRHSRSSGSGEEAGSSTNMNVIRLPSSPTASERHADRNHRLEVARALPAALGVEAQRARDRRQQDVVDGHAVVVLDRAQLVERAPRGGEVAGRASWGR